MANSACSLGSLMLFANIKSCLEIIIIRASHDSSVLQQKDKYIIIDTVREHLTIGNMTQLLLTVSKVTYS